MWCFKPLGFLLTFFYTENTELICFSNANLSWSSPLFLNLKYSIPHRSLSITQSCLHIFLNCIYFSICFWLCWVFMAAWACSQLQQAEATLQLRHAGLSPWCLHLLQSMSSRVRGPQQLWFPGSRATGSIIEARGLSSSGSHGILLSRDQTHVSCTRKWFLHH